MQIAMFFNSFHLTGEMGILVSVANEATGTIYSGFPHMIYLG